MATNKKITELPEISSAASDDVLAIVDVSTNITSKIQVGNLPATSLYDRPFLTVGYSNADFIVDGVADDVQIQQALDALPGTGGTVYIKEGTYSISAPVIIDDYQYLIGAGTNGTTLLAISGLNDFVIKTVLSGSHRHMYVGHLKIDGNRGGNTTGGGIHVFNSRNSTFYDLWITECDEEAVFLDGSASLGWFNMVDRCEVDLCDAGFHARFCEHNWFTRNTMSFIDGKGIFCESDLDFILDNQLDYITGYEVHCYFGVGLWNISNNSFDRPQTDAVVIEGADRCVIDNNYFDSAPAGCSSVINNSSDQLTVTNNRMAQTGGSGSFGIREVGATDRCNYSNNILTGSTYPLSIDGSSTNGIRFNNQGDTINRTIVDLEVPDEVYGSGWNGSVEVPTKNAVYDKIQSLAPTGGDVVGPASSTDNAIARFDSTTGKLLQNSTVTVGDTGGIATTIAASGNAVGVTITQNDTTNNPAALAITNTGTGRTISATATGNAGTSDSGGGAFLFKDTGNTGYGMNLYTSTKNSGERFRIMKDAAHSATVSGAQTITTLSTLLTVASTSGFPSSGTILIENATSIGENNNSFFVNYTSVDATHFIGTAGTFYKGTSVTVIDNAVVKEVDQTDSHYMFHLHDYSDQFANAKIKIASAHVDMEFCQFGFNATIGQGQFGQDIPVSNGSSNDQVDVWRFLGRNDTNSGFNPAMIYARPGAAGQGKVGIGFQNKTAPTTLTAHLHVKNDTNFGDTNAAALIGAIIQGAASQTANLQEWRNNAGTVLSSVDASGLHQIASSTPASAVATGVAGTITWDSSFIYICIAANTWKRVAIATW